MKRLNVLIAAYACRPDRGSEPGVGWNVARELVKYHNVWVLTRPNNRQAIDAELKANPRPNLQVVYSDLPKPFQWWNLDKWDIHLRYYLWQLKAYATARSLHHDIHFDIVQHVTYSRYCDPSFLAFLSTPFVWGPLGGGESAPYPFWRDFGIQGQIYETLRDLSRWLGERGPLVRFTVNQSAVALVSTTETAARLRTMGVQRIETISGQTGINQLEVEQLAALPDLSVQQTVRFLSLGRLLHWKGFHLGLQAFAQTHLPDCEYWIVGDGPERRRLEALAGRLNVSDRVRFLGNLPRDQALNALGECSILVHPSLHDFSPTVCLEAMAAGRSVICLDLGGPAGQVTEEVGIRVPAHNPAQTVCDLAVAMTQLALDRSLQIQMGKAGQTRVRELYNWDAKGQFLVNLYEQILT
jgi:glycosyltransferase involved in cell wall biosynthesis